VVRRLVRGETGPSGGPALTDVLGTCTAWGEGRCVVVREDGSAVEIALADIVSGKPVPPRPSVRSRVPSIDVERHTSALWPELVEEPLGSWALRRTPTPPDGRPRRRGNSLLAMGDPGLPLAEASARARAFYTSYGQPSLAQVETGSDITAGLQGLGWEPLGSGSAHCQLVSVARALRSCPAPAADLASPILDEHGDVAVVDLGGTARGEAALDGDWVGLHGLVVDTGQRRRGLGTAVVAELLDWAASRGATTAWLHVEVDNPGALALYGRLGFVTHHSYDYLRG
jgi:GNAT superfamily N-acetyltransferase